LSSDAVHRFPPLIHAHSVIYFNYIFNDGVMSASKQQSPFVLPPRIVKW